MVGLPTPLQQRWVMGNIDAVEVPVVMTAGAYLDKLAERLGWYPRWMDRARLDWAYRIAREPRRMWRRYAFLAGHYSWLLAGEGARRAIGRGRRGEGSEP